MGLGSRYRSKKIDIGQRHDGGENAALTDNKPQFPRGRMGATAKKTIGIMATAAAAMIVTLLTNKAKVGSVNRNDTANDPARSRSPIAEASAMMNPITLLRWRCNISYQLLVDG